MAHDVFISASSKDKPVADDACARLEAAGIRCWMAPRDITPGQNWGEAIIDAIAASRVLVLIYSSHANASQQVLREVERAVHRNVAIVPFRIEDVPMSKALEYFVSVPHWMDAFPTPTSPHFDQLANTVHRLLSACADSPQQRGPPCDAPRIATTESKRVRKRGRMLMALLLLSLFAGAGALIWRLLPREQVGSQIFINSLDMKFVEIKPGKFFMGTRPDEVGREDDEALLSVRITQPFMMGVYEVTVGQFAAFVKDSTYQTDAEKDGHAEAWTGVKFEDVKGASWQQLGFPQRDDHPVVLVSWNDAVAFCEWLSRKEARTYRLPTEAEWEYACRAGTHTAYPWGDDPDEGDGFANAADLTAKATFPDLATFFRWRDGFAFTAPVGTFKPNAWGLHDMIGSAYEWCGDTYAPYPVGGSVDSTKDSESKKRVLRGGSWFNNPRFCRAGNRMALEPGRCRHTFGFRVVLELP